MHFTTEDDPFGANDHDGESHGAVSTDGQWSNTLRPPPRVGILRLSQAVLAAGFFEPSMISYQIALLVSGGLFL